MARLLVLSAVASLFFSSILFYLCIAFCGSTGYCPPIYVAICIVCCTGLGLAMLISIYSRGWRS